MVYINSKTALAILAFCSSAFAVPFEAKRSSGTPIPLTRHITLNATNTNADRLRRKSLEARTGGTANAPAINNVQIYIMNIQIGNQTFKMLVDTGSSNTWVGVSPLICCLFVFIDVTNTFCLEPANIHSRSRRQRRRYW
jgi:hypothetical protein